MSTEKEINLESVYNSLQRKEFEQRKVIKKQYLEIQELKKQLNLHRVVGQSEQLSCIHDYVNVGYIDNVETSVCSKCGDNKETQFELEFKPSTDGNLELEKFIEHLNSYPGMEEIRFDFMLIDYLG